jgi:hypothetical protein
MDREFKDTKRVYPNKLAIERLNRERQRVGLKAVGVPTVPIGEEVQSTGEAAPSQQIAPWYLAAQSTSNSTSTGTVGLPTSADNSTLPCFPPVRSQDYLQSCAAFATGYYVGTHMLALARNIDTRNDADNSNKLSPKWLYNFVNNGQDNGSWFSSNIDVLLKLGAPSWQLFPYEGNPKTQSNYLEWSRDPAVWRAATSNRFKEAGRIAGVDTAAGLNQLKGLLANGYLVLFATRIDGWQYTAFSNDPSTTADDGFAGRTVCEAVMPVGGGHAMTIVGYNDNVWTDLNRNGAVDAGEKGALKIVNSHGPYWKDQGFIWIAYAALKGTNYGGTSEPFWYDEVYWITARQSYTPTMLAEFTLSHSARHQLTLQVGSSETSTSTTQSLFPAPTDYVFSYGAPSVFRNLGGSFAFDGGTSAVDGTFVFDATDIFRQGAGRYYLRVEDNALGSPCTVKSFRLTTPGGVPLATATSGLPANVDAGTFQISVDFNSQPQQTPTITSGSTASATVGQSFSFQVTANNNPTSFSASSLPPGLSINSANGLISGTPTQAGQFVSTVSASNAGGTGSATLTVIVTAPLDPAPQITSAGSASGAVGVAFSYQITANGSPSLYGASSLPPGTDINPQTGLVSGTPTMAGTFEMNVSAANASGSGSKKVSVSIAPPPIQAPVITSPDNASGTSGSEFTYRIEASNSPTSYGAEGLPDTLSVNPATGVISGTLPAPRAYVITLRASNAAGSGYRQMELTVYGNAVFGPPNDDFSNAIALTGAITSGSGNNAQATSQPGEPSHAGQTSHSVWWSWTAPYSGPAAVSTAGSSFDTVLAVYTGTSVSALGKIGENDDGEGLKTSAVSFTAAAGTTYMIAVDGFGDATGNITLAVSQPAASGPPNDAFANRSTLSGSNVSVSASNAGATRETQEPSHAGYEATKSVWWTWTAPSGGRVTIDTKGSSIDTLLAVYTGSTLSQLGGVAADDQSGGNNTSQVRFTAVQGTTYQIAVDGWQGDAGGIVLSVTLEQTTGPDNDNLATARQISGSSGSDTGTNQNATAEAGEPAHAGSAATRSIWWRWTAPASGAVRWNTIGSSFDTVLGVYSGGSVQALTPIASDDQSGGGGASSLEFEAAAGSTYFIAVDGYGGATGSVQLQHAYVGAPANDNFVSAAVITGNSAAVSAGNVNATSELDEPAHAGSVATRSLWWQWTPPTSGNVLISTAGSTFDTVLGVYTGASLAELQPVASNDDSGYASTSEVSFPALAGTTYYIAVDGYGGQGGQIQLAVDQTSSGALYETDFENFPFGADGMQGFEGWTASAPGTGAHGIFKPDGVSQAAWLGYYPPEQGASFAYISRPVNYQPAAEDDGVVVFRSNMTMFDSTAITDFKRDWFAVELLDISGIPTASIYFDNEAGQIWVYESWQSEAFRFFSTGVYFSKGEKRELRVVYDLKAKTWAASWGETPLFETRPLSPDTDGNLTIGSVDIAWYQGSPEGYGDNFLVIDDYSLSTSVAREPVITSAAEASAVVGQPFAYQIAADNDPSAYSASGLPAGLSANSQTGLITGTPQDAGLFAVVLGAGNTAGSDTKVLFLSVSAAASAPVITSATSASGKVGDYFKYQITADNKPTDFSADGLPAGLSVDSYTGLISGTPSAAGSYSVTLYAINTQGMTTATLNLTVVSTDANLSGMQLSQGSLAPSFSSSTTSYTASVAHASSSISITPITQDSGATVSVNGSAVASGSASPQIPLQVGLNTIAVQVTAQDGITIKNYTVAVTRAAGISFSSWSGNAAVTGPLLNKYAIGGATNQTAVSEAPVLSVAGNVISITAIVRTNDAALSVTGQVSSSLSSWTSAGVSSTPSTNTLGVPTGCQRLTFSAPIPSNSKGHFIRLRTTLTGQ